MRRASSLAWLVIFALAAGPAGAQSPTPPQSRSDAYWYGRLGYGTIAAEQRFGGFSLGLGRRIEREGLGLDVLIVSGQRKLLGTGPADLHQIGGLYTHADSASLMTVKGLYFARPRARATPYVGVGGGWRIVSFGRVFAIPDDLRTASTPDIDEQWRGKGLEGEVTVGYAFARTAASTRYFVQADLTHPFYRVTRYSDRSSVVGDRYAPSLVVSLGAGWSVD